MATTTELDMEHLDKATVSELLGEIVKRTTTLHDEIRLLTGECLTELGVAKVHENFEEFEKVVEALNRRIG